MGTGALLGGLPLDFELARKPLVVVVEKGDPGGAGFAYAGVAGARGSHAGRERDHAQP